MTRVLHPTDNRELPAPQGPCKEQRPAGRRHLGTSIVEPPGALPRCMVTAPGPTCPGWGHPSIVLWGSKGRARHSASALMQRRGSCSHPALGQRVLAQPPGRHGRHGAWSQERANKGSLQYLTDVSRTLQEEDPLSGGVWLFPSQC